MKINNWDYQVDTSGGKFIPKVTPFPDIKIPNTLSKYYALNANNVNAFINRKFHVSEPSQLNDICDSLKLSIDFSNISNEEFLRNINNTRILENLKEDLLSENRLQTLNDFRDLLYSDSLSEIGILSLTEKHNNDLMWSHYTKNKGFLVEYNIDQFDENVFKGPFKINYIPKLNPHIIKNKEEYFDILLSTFLTKKDVWKYEDEFRFLCTPDDGFQYKVNRGLNNGIGKILQDRFASYPSSAIKRIVLGFSFLEKHEIMEEKDSRTHILLFKGESGILKSCLFNEIITRKIELEMICLDSRDFEFKPAPCLIKHLEGSKYKMIIDTKSVI